MSNRPELWKGRGDDWCGGHGLNTGSLWQGRGSGDCSGGSSGDGSLVYLNAARVGASQGRTIIGYNIYNGWWGDLVQALPIGFITSLYWEHTRTGITLRVDGLVGNWYEATLNFVDFGLTLRSRSLDTQVWASWDVVVGDLESLPIEAGNYRVEVILLKG